MKTVLKKWMEAKRDLDAAKKRELALRQEIIKDWPGGLGTTKIEGRDFTMKIVRGVSRSVDAEALLDIWDDLNEVEQACISYKPTLDALLYARLPENSTLSRAITVKPTLPTVSIEVTDDPKD